MTWYVRVLFEDGDTIETRINGTKEAVQAYYAPGQVLNLGTRGDRFCRVKEIAEMRRIDYAMV